MIVVFFFLYINKFLDFHTAVRFADDGIVLQIVNISSATYFWNCTWWSDYSSESERLFIGGLMPFKFISIRHIGQRKNYENFIFPITVFNTMINGYAQWIRKATESDVKYLSKRLHFVITNFSLPLATKFLKFLLVHFALCMVTFQTLEALQHNTFQRNKIQLLYGSIYTSHYGHNFTGH